MMIPSFHGLVRASERRKSQKSVCVRVIDRPFLGYRRYRILVTFTDKKKALAESNFVDPHPSDCDPLASAHDPEDLLPIISLCLHLCAHRCHNRQPCICHHRILQSYLFALLQIAKFHADHQNSIAPTTLPLHITITNGAEGAGDSRTHSRFTLQGSAQGYHNCPRQEKGQCTVRFIVCERISGRLTLLGPGTSRSRLCCSSAQARWRKARSS